MEDFTPIPNGYLEAKARLLLSGTEHKILLVIERETFGFHREQANITLEHFSRVTGVAKKHLCRAIKKLRDKGLVIPQTGNDYSIGAFPELGINHSLNGERSFPKQGIKQDAYSSINKKTKKETPKETRKAAFPVQHKTGYAQDFLELVWEPYPRKEEKSKAYKAFLGLIKAGFSAGEINRAALHYAAVCRRRRTENRYIKLLSTFLGMNRPFLDYLEEPKTETAGREVSDFSHQESGYWQDGVFHSLEEQAGN